MSNEPSGWWALLVAVIGVVGTFIQILQNMAPWRQHRRTRISHVRNLKVLGISYTSRRVESHDEHS